MCRVDSGGVEHESCGSNADYDHILESDSLPRAQSDAGRSRERGYAVELSGDDWLFFSALEPAYAYGRAGSLSAQASSCSVREAVFEVQRRADGQVVRTLHLLLGADYARRSVAGDRKLLSDFVSAVTGAVSPRQLLA